MGTGITKGVHIDIDIDIEPTCRSGSCWRRWDKNHSLDNKFMTMIITMVKVKQMMIKITHLMIKVTYYKMNKITPSKALPGQLKIPTIGEHSTFKDEN